jgi:hypothetical protein
VVEITATCFDGRVMRDVGELSETVELVEMENIVDMAPNLR